MEELNKSREFKRNVANYFGRQGYLVEQDRWIKGKSGSNHLVDVYARKDDEVIACRCAYWRGPVGEREILYWKGVCEDINAEPAFCYEAKR